VAKSQAGLKIIFNIYGSKASLKHLMMSAQKTRLVIDVIARCSRSTLDQLQFINKKAALPVAT
jgi:ribosomal protein L22